MKQKGKKFYSIHFIDILFYVVMMSKQTTQLFPFFLFHYISTETRSS